MTSLRLAAFQGHVEIVRLLIDSGANIEAADSVSKRSLVLTVSPCNIGLIVWWNKHDDDRIIDWAKMNSSFRSSVSFCLCYNDCAVEVDYSIIMYYIHINQTGMRPLFGSCARGHLETARLLIEKGADLEVEDSVSTISWIPLCYCMSLYISVHPPIRPFLNYFLWWLQLISALRIFMWSISMTRIIAIDYH